jgi:hypothetical protein
MSSLADVFPEGDYRFHLTLRRGEPRDFFSPRDPTGAVLRERARWIAEEPARYAALTREGEALLTEFAEMCREWGVLGARPPPVANGPATGGGRAPVLALGAALEPDVLFLSPDAEGAFRLRGGALCFPTGWALEEKIGHTLDFIHGAVPGLNPALAPSISQFLARLRPGIAFHRDNWGIAATDEYNLHPARRVPAPALPVRLDRLWLRVEQQALLALPRSGGVAFGIRIALHRLDGLAADPVVANGLRRALATMPAAMAAYKRLDAVRDGLVAALIPAG